MRALRPANCSCSPTRTSTPSTALSPRWSPRRRSTAGRSSPALACHGRGYVERGAHLVKFDLWLAGSEPRTLDDRADGRAAVHPGCLGGGGRVPERPDARRHACSHGLSVTRESRSGSSHALSSGTTTHRRGAGCSPSGTPAAASSPGSDTAARKPSRNDLGRRGDGYPPPPRACRVAQCAKRVARRASPRRGPHAPRRRRRAPCVVRRRAGGHLRREARQPALMRVLMLAHNVAWQGSAIRALSLARPLARLGHDLTVIASRGSVGPRFTGELVDGVRLLQPPDVLPRRIRNGGLSPVDLAARVAHVLRYRYDVVHAFEQRPCSTVPALLARPLRHAVYVADWADLWGPAGMAAEWPAPQRASLGAFDGVWQAFTRRRADAVTVISTDLRERAIELGLPRDRIHLIPIGANDDLFEPAGSARRPTQARDSRGCARPRPHGLCALRRPAPRGRLLRARTTRATRSARHHRPAGAGARRGGSGSRRSGSPAPARRPAVCGARHGDGMRRRDARSVHAPAAQHGALPEPGWRLPCRGSPGSDEPDGRPRSPGGRGGYRRRRARGCRRVRRRGARAARLARPASRDGCAGAGAGGDHVLVARPRCARSMCSTASSSARGRADRPSRSR